MKKGIVCILLFLSLISLSVAVALPQSKKASTSAKELPFKYKKWLEEGDESDIR